ncbi:MAG: hypothetical protein KJ949_02350 [Nanoarchaeota archaeon]|nr:hypothetical protein [Nanoarchaeota archaeon]
MIKNNDPLSMAEASAYVGKNSDSDTDLAGFIKKFTKMKPKEVAELKKEIQELDLVKVNPRHLSKIIDLMPEDKEDIMKIFVDIGLNEDETNKILDIIKKYR